MDKKALLATCLVSGGILPSLSRVKAACRRDVPILAYHRVWDIADEDRFPFDAELVSASIADFGWQMEYVRENFNPITCETLLRVLDGRIEAPPRPVVITFDDGFEDNYQNAFPILSALHIPATIFLSTGYIDGETSFWYDRLAHLILQAPDRKLELKGVPGPLALGPSRASRREVLHRILRALKNMPNECRLDVLRYIDAELGGCFDPTTAIESRPMNWNQVREMSAAGIEFGSHTVTHPILSQLSDTDLAFELTESRRAIESQIGKPVECLSYPVGGAAAFDQRVQHAARRAGYRLAASYIPGTNLVASPLRFGLRRQHVERYTSRAYFAALLGLPELFQ